jgi:hypothetical protein
LPEPEPPETRPDQTLVVFRRESTAIHARAFTVPRTEAFRDKAHADYPYPHITGPLRRRGLDCFATWSLDDYIIEAPLPDGSTLLVCPPQDPAVDHPPGFPPSWHASQFTVAWHQTIYNSQPGGAHARYGASVPRLLAALDTHLDQLGFPPRTTPALTTSYDADSVLHRAGFIPVVPARGEPYHRLPYAMTSPAEQRAVLTATVDALRADGFDVTCDPALTDPGVPPRNDYEVSLGDRIGHLADTITTATHSREVTTALSELTAPGDGVLTRTGEILETAADWQQTHGGLTGAVHADRLRLLARRLQTTALEIRAARNDLADQHTPARAESSPVAGQASPGSRERAARLTSSTTSPSTGTPPAPPPPGTSTAPGHHR